MSHSLGVHTRSTQQLLGSCLHTPASFSQKHCTEVLSWRCPSICTAPARQKSNMPFRTRTPKAQFFHIEWKTLRKHLLTTSFDPILDDWDGKTLGNVVTDLHATVEGSALHRNTDGENKEHLTDRLTRQDNRDHEGEVDGDQERPPTT